MLKIITSHDTLNCLNPFRDFAGWTRRGHTSRSLVGVKFSSQGLAVARITVDKSRPSLTLADFQFCKPPAWESVLTELVRRHGLKGQPCVGCLEGSTYQVIPITHPGLAEDELREALRWQVCEILDFPVEEAVTDYLELPAQESSHQMLDYLEPPVQQSNRQLLVVVARRGQVAKRAQLIQKAGLKLVAIDIRETALRNLASLFPQDREGVALIGFSWEEGFLMVSHQGELVVTRSIKMGESSLRQRIPGGEDYGDAAIATLDQLVLEVQRLLDYHDSHFQLPLATLILPPSTRRAPIFERYFRANLNVNVLTLELGEIFKGAAAFDPEQQNLCLFAIGAAARCLDRESKMPGQGK